MIVEGETIGEERDDDEGDGGDGEGVMMKITATNHVGQSLYTARSVQRWCPLEASREQWRGGGEGDSRGPTIQKAG